MALAVEQDEDLLKASQQHFLVTAPLVQEICGGDFLEALQRRTFSAILVGGGSPCQGNSALNQRRRGWEDPRSQQPLHLQRLVQELRDMQPHQAQVPVLSFLENVASSPPADGQQVHRIDGQHPS